MSILARNVVKVVLIDISGTVLVGNQLIGNAANAILRLRDHEIRFRFLSNTTKESKRRLLERLDCLGLNLQADEVVTSLTAAKSFITKRKLRPHLVLDEDTIEEFDDVDTANPNCVLVGLAPSHFNYNEMNNTFQYLLNGAEFIAVHKGRYYKREDGLALGPGPFVEALEFATGVNAKIIGKPEKEFFDLVKEDLRRHDARTEFFMIGDDVYDDIQGSQNAGCHGILVKTGKYQEGDENKLQHPPFGVVDSVSEAVNMIIDY